MSPRPNDTDLIRMPASALRSVGGVLLREHGAVEAARLLHDMGLACGETFFDLLREDLNADNAGEPASLRQDAFWSRLSGFFSDLGWGRIEHERLSDGVFALTVEDWVESGPDSRGGSHFTAGLLADILHRLAGQDLAVLQVAHAGGEGSARFLVGGPDTVDAVYGRIRDGADYAQAVEAVSVVD